MTETSKVLVVGSSNTDMVINMSRLPAPGETILGEDFFVVQGGKGANQAVAAARAGADVSFIACLGDDSFGKHALAAVETEGVGTRCITVLPDQVSGVAAILVDRDGENTIVVAPGANGLLTPEIIGRAKGAFDNAAICLLQLESPLPAVVKAIDLAWEREIPVILNPAPAGDLPEELFQKLYLITPNETETEHLTGILPVTEEDAKQAAYLLVRKGVTGVIITLGSRGAMLVTDDGSVLIPSPEVVATDTTAAGDAFNGALASALSRNLCLEEALRFANCAGALAVTKPGAQPSLPYFSEITELVHRQ